MRAFFIGGTVDNSELDLAGNRAPQRYPTQGGAERYRLHRTAERDGRLLYAIYAAPGLQADTIERIVEERGYERRFPTRH